MKSGTIVGLHVSRGGVPKLAIESARVSAAGMEGDAQKHLKSHGGPTRALCLFSREVMDGLEREGHPIMPGTIGENVLISGLDWAQVGIGTKLKLGEVEIEITDYTTPCRFIAASFLGGDFMRIAQKTHPGESRVYARVLAAGELRVGDEVRITE